MAVNFCLLGCVFPYSFVYVGFGCFVCVHERMGVVLVG
jgi:hypothetical protein